jgi:hypothetical protein
MVGRWSCNHFLGIFLMLFEDLAFCFKIGLSHLSQIADFYVGIFNVGKIYVHFILLEPSIFDPLDDMILVLNLKNLHLVEELHDLDLDVKNVVEEFVCLNQ